MKRALLAVATLALAAGAASAQPYPPPGPPPGANYPGWNHDEFWRGAPDSPRDRIRFMQDRIDRAIANRTLRPQDARAANGELNNIRGRLARMHMHDGGRLDEQDRATIQGGLDELSHRLAMWTRRNSW